MCNEQVTFENQFNDYGNNQSMGNCKRCGVYDELYHSEICDSCVTEQDFERWEAE